MNSFSLAFAPQARLAPISSNLSPTNTFNLLHTFPPFAQNFPTSPRAIHSTISRSPCIMGSITNFLRNCATKKIKVACGPVKSDANEVMPTQPNNPIAIGSSPPAEKFQKSCAGNGIHSSKPDDTAKGFQVRSFR